MELTNLLETEIRRLNNGFPFAFSLPKDIEIFSEKIEMPKENIYKASFWAEVQQNIWVPHSVSLRSAHLWTNSPLRTEIITSFLVPKAKRKELWGESSIFTHDCFQTVLLSSALKSFICEYYISLICTFSIVAIVHEAWSSSFFLEDLYFCLLSLSHYSCLSSYWFQDAAR